MNNVSKTIRQAYYNALNGNISVEVYKEDVPKGIGNHVLIRVESETDGSNKSAFVTNPVVITDVCCVFDNSINPDAVDDIDNEVRNILLPSVGARLIYLGIEITNIKPKSSTLLAEDDGTKRYYRKITRWTQRVSHN